VSDDHLRVPGGKIGGLRDHPDAGFRTVRAGHDAADIVLVDGHRLRLLRGKFDRRTRQCHRDSDRGHAEIQAASGRHIHSLLGFPALRPAMHEARWRNYLTQLSAETAMLSITSAANRACIGECAAWARLAPPQFTNVPPRSSSIWMRTIWSNEFSALKPSSPA